MKLIYFYLLLSFFTLKVLAEDKTQTNMANYRISGESQVVSQYLVKGLSYSDNNPAMQASFLAHLGSQVKLGVWGSNISNLSAVDDNFWFKFVADISLEFSDKLFANLYIHDSHYYKSDQRNGQSLGAKFEYKSYEFNFEWMSNLEGTRSTAEYFSFSKYFDYKKDFRIGGSVGMTSSHTSSLNNYFDFKALGQYIFNSTSNAELGVTFCTNGSQFGKRGDPALYLGLKFIY